MVFTIRIHSAVTEHPLFVSLPSNSNPNPNFKPNPNPKFVERRGIIRLFRTLVHHPSTSDSSIPTTRSTRSTLLFVVAVPNYFSSDDLLRFFGSLIADVSEFIIVRNDGMEDRYSVLIRTENQVSADAFYRSFNGKRFSPPEVEICHILFVLSSEFTELAEIASNPPPGYAELPTCPICLERLDQDTSGIQSTLCDHSFQCSCISKWTYLSCRVCRLCQQQDDRPNCSVCDRSENLWVCIICGFVGCGRYEKGHTLRHCKKTQHCFSLNLETQRVWDYEGECYVHRLNHSKADGKSAVVDSNCMSHDGDCGACGHGEDSEMTGALFGSKVEAITDEYNHLLANQLENQRQYYESLLVEAKSKEITVADAVEKALTRRMQDLQRRLEKHEEDKKTVLNMPTLNVKIDKFTGRNSFSLWQIKMRALLKQQGLWAPLSMKTTDVETAEMAVLEEKAHSTIMLCLADDIITEVAEEETASGLWLKLKSLYMTKSLTNKLLLKQHLFSLRMQEGMPLREHLDQLNTILLELRNIDVKVEDEDAALILLVSLPLSYENFVQSFIVGKDTISLEEVRSLLHTRELRHKVAGTVIDNQAAGLVATGGKGQGNPKKKKSKKSSPKGPKPTYVCNYCKEQGHWKTDCPKKMQQDKSGSATVAEENTNSEDDIALVADGQTRQSDVWVLDSGASYHICSRREWFTTYEQIDGGNVSMANSSVCKAVGIGSIKIRTHDDKFCTLNDVRHVPLMTKNLISLSLLDNRGFSFKGEGGVLYVCKGSSVVLKGVKSGTLYLVQGSTLSGFATVASSEVHEDNMTKLWHMRLGHMSERGMQVLSKGDLLGGHKVKDLDICEHCVFGKLHRTKFPKAVYRTKDESCFNERPGRVQKKDEGN